MKQGMFRIEGVGPTGLLMNPRVDEPAPKNPKPKEEAEKRIIRDPQGRICLLDDHIYSVLVNAGKKVTLKAKAKVTPSKGPSEVYSFLTVDQRYLPLSNGTPGEAPTWEPDVRYTYNAQRQQLLSIRPHFPKWALEGSVTIDDSKVKPTLVRELFDVAGDCCLGSFRGRYGRFRVTSWEVKDVEETEAVATA
jgi:hypothetical protein